jgi:hypothetical protein
LKGGPALRIQSEFNRGRTGQSITYGNEQLSGATQKFNDIVGGRAGEGDFEIDDIEFWGFE